jgi:hypothetical protein
LRFEFDSKGYVQTILCGCYTGSCIGYEGLVPTEPEEYADMDDWADRAKVQAYYLNEEGNLTYDANRAAELCPEDEVVFSRYSAEQIKAMGIFDAIYPIGSLYISVNDASPAVLFGGTWKKIEDRFLLAASSTYSAGTTGGSTRHQHTSPTGYNANNKLLGMSFAHGTNRANVNGEYAALSQTVTTSSGAYSWVLPKTDSVSHMPPYLAVHMWQRIEDPIPDDSQGFIDKDGNTFTDAGANEFMVKVAR